MDSPLPIVGQYLFPMEAYTNDFRGKPMLHAIGGLLMQAATRHADDRGFGYSAISQQQRAWVLSRLAIEMTACPVDNTQIEVRTWVPEINRLFTERCFALSDAAGRHIGDARSLWAAIDTNTRKPTSLDDLSGFHRFLCAEPSAIEAVRKIPPLADAPVISSFTVSYSDIDINGHLNSMKYIEHLLNTFGLEDFRRSDIRRFEICFLSEGLYGESLDIVRKQEAPNLFTLEIRTGTKAICSARVEWNGL